GRRAEAPRADVDGRGARLRLLLRAALDHADERRHLRQDPRALRRGGRNGAHVHLRLLFAGRHGPQRRPPADPRGRGSVESSEVAPMSFEGFPGRRVREKLDHPVIDADAHIIECDFAHLDFVTQIAGPEVARRVAVTPASHGPTVRGFWWGLPSGPHTSDRAMAQLPRYFRSKLDECGIDFAHCCTTRGLGHFHQADEEIRRASCRALNMLYAEMFKDVGDRLRPVAVIPTYTPKEAIEELEFAVKELGHKAVMIGTELRGPVRKAEPGADPFLSPAQMTRS